MAFLIALMIVVPLIELWLILQVGSLIGAVPTIVLLLACSLFGAWLVRHQGRAAWSRFTDAMSSGRVPAKETADGALVILAGALLLTPGFLTDLVGLLLLTPFVRRLVRSTALAGLLKRSGWLGVTYTGANAANSAWKRNRPASGVRQPSRQPYDVDGTAIDVDSPQLDR
jgi:UPF0716 protein FxsA